MRRLFLETRCKQSPRIAPDDQRPSRANAKAAARPMLPSVPVMMQTFPDSLRDISHANFGGQLRDFREIPGDDLARLVGQR